MTRWWIIALVLALVPGAALAQEAQYQEPKEEDEDLVEQTDYVFNPIQASKEFKIGEFYWKKKSFRAAAGRYEEATKWNPGFADAYWKLGLAKEKIAAKELLATERKLTLEAAREAYKKYLELAPEGKEAKDARKRIAKLERP